MRVSRTILIFFSSLFCITVHAQVDTTFSRTDTAEVFEVDKMAQFFESNEKASAPGKTLLVTKARKTVNLASFMETLGSFANHALADLDNDGKKELLVYNFTGGAHCCDEIYVFKNTAANKYQHVAKLYAGNTFIGDSSKFYYDLHEQFGYFFTCYACGYEDTADAAPIKVSKIVLKYKNGILSTRRGDQELRSKINDNLAKLGEQPYEKLDPEMQQDNGLRKEVALNLAVFYFSFGKNLAETQKLFNKYYKFPDAKQVWADFVKTLNNVKKETDL